MNRFDHFRGNLDIFVTASSCEFVLTANDRVGVFVEACTYERERQFRIPSRLKETSSASRSNRTRTVRPKSGAGFRIRATIAFQVLWRLGYETETDAWVACPGSENSQKFTRCPRGIAVKRTTRTENTTLILTFGTFIGTCCAWE